VILVSSAAALGGLIFGYDTAIIADAIAFITAHFHLSTGASGFVVSCVLLGAIAGAAVAGPLSEAFGRRKVLFATAALFALGAAGSAAAATSGELVAARIVCGLAIGMAGLLAPVYIAEVAPARWRGGLVSTYQLAIGLGQLLAYCIGEAVLKLGSHASQTTTEWRWMLGIGVVPAMLFFGLLLFITESPRWLEKQGHTDEAVAVLRRANGEEQVVERELDGIRTAIAESSGSWRELLAPGVRMTLIIGIVITFLQQWAGINAITYYAPKIFQSSGASLHSSFLDTVFLGLVNVAFTAVALLLMDRVGRRPLLIGGTAVMTVILAAVGWAFDSGNSNSVLVLALILAYMAVFMATIGSGMWVLLSEIFPTRMRGPAMAIATISLWAADYMVSQLFPSFLKDWGGGVTFWIFGGGSLLLFGFITAFVPETRYRTLEQIEADFRAGGLLRRAAGAHGS